MSAVLLLLAASVLAWPQEVRRLPTEADGVIGTPGYPRWAVPAVAGAAAMAAVFWSGGVYAAAAAAVAGSTAWHRYRRRVHRARWSSEVDSLATGVEVVIGELRVGAHPAAACEVAAQECGGVTATVLRGAASRSRLGGRLGDGFTAVDPVIATELARLAAAWRVSERYGLALAELLEAVREDLLGRRRFGRRTEASLAGARATALVLAGLPILGVVLGQAMGADPLAILFGGGVGGMLLLIGTALCCAGLLWTDGITGRVTS